MKPLTIPTTILLTTTALVVPCAAQITPTMAPQIFPQYSQGLFSNLPVGITMSEPGEEDQWLVRSPGVNGGIPTEWDGATFSPGAVDHPDFSAAALALGFALPVGAPAPRFGGISTGGEITPVVDSTGVMQMTPSNWYMLSVAVKTGARGVPTGLLASRRASGRDPSGDILSYYAVGSTGINPVFVNTVRLEYSREQLQLANVDPVQPVTTPPPPPRSVANHDFGIGVISIDPQNRGLNMFPVRNCFYFTFTQSWVTEMASASLTYTIGGVAANASTIYVMTWETTPTFHWSAPAIAFDHTVLFPGKNVGDVEIDALSVDKGLGNSPNEPARAVFSLTALTDVTSGTTFDQVLVYQAKPSICLTQALRTVETIQSVTVYTPVSTKFGLLQRTSFTTEGEPDDVGSTCGGDPKEAFIEGAVIALAPPTAPAGAGTLGLTAVRVTLPTDPTSDEEGIEPSSDTLHVQVAGLDHLPHPFGFIVVSFEGGYPGTIGPVLIQTFWAGRNTVDFAIPVSNTPLTTTTRIRAQCWGFTSAPVLLRESWTLRMKL